MPQSRQKPRRSPLAPGATVLAHAAQVVESVALRGRSAQDALAPFESHADRAAVQAVALGTLRWYLRLAPAVESLLSRPPHTLSGPLRALLVSAAHQIEYSRNAPQASVHVAVDAARALGEGRATGLVNAVLRRFVAQREALLIRQDTDAATRTAHPRWLVEQLRTYWPGHLEELLAANNRPPPMVLRVNLSSWSRPECLAELARRGLGARALPWAPAAIELDAPVAVTALPGFSAGRVSVQDAGAQLAAPLLDARAGMKVLDACAAPGGKTLHLLEQAPALGRLVALDADARRLERVRENLQRAGYSAHLVGADLRARAALPPGERFERILVDAPCSSTGVMRRHPDIKLLRRPADIASFAALQLEILQAAFARLLPGGRLLYCTCSVLPEENEAVIGRLLALEGGARPAAMPPAGDLAPGALERPFGLQLLPGMPAGTDGFYYACVEKTTAGN